MSRLRKTIVALAVAATLSCAVAASADQRYGFGRPPTQQEISGWNIDARGPDGKGLPPGRGSVKQGEQLFADKCASCHGDFGEGNGRMPELVGGRGSLAKENPIKTVGSYWPYAPTLFDYIRRAMPFTAPQSLSNDEVYALTAYILNLNGIVPQGAVLDAGSVAAIKMPNRNGFVPDPRPDVHNVACMANCKPGAVRITSDLARTLQVTPNQQAATVASNAQSVPPPKEVPFASVQRIVAVRCTVCHAVKPTQPGITSAPAGVKLDTPERIRAAAARINARAVATQGMPLGNVTHMTEEERTLLGAWIAGGAKL